MSRRWLLSLLCLSCPVLLAQLTSAHSELKVNEAGTRLLLQRDQVEVFLVVENHSSVKNARVHLELLDPKSRVAANTIRVKSIDRGTQTLSFSLPMDLSKMAENDRRQLPWYRLSYNIEHIDSLNTITAGFISLSEITPDLFDLRIATSWVAREGGQYRVRVQTAHPINRHPVAQVRVDGIVGLEADNDQYLKLAAYGSTDSHGDLVLEFQLPTHLPELSDSSLKGEIQVIGQRGGLTAEAKGEVLFDYFPRILISTDKPIYQPGQLMHTRAVVLTATKRAFANQNILFRVSDPEGTDVYRTVTKSSRFGIATADWPIPKNVRLGDYRIWVGIDGREEAEQVNYQVRVSRYDLPNFSVTVEPDRKYYLPGQNASVKVRADYLFGRPVTHGRVRVVRELDQEWNYQEQKWDVEEGESYEGTTDASGIFVANIELVAAHRALVEQDYSHFKDITFSAFFTDPTTNRTEQRRFDLRATREAIHVYLIEESSPRSGKLPVALYLSTLYADGSPARANVTVSLNSTISNSGQQSAHHLATVRTNRYGLAKVNGYSLLKKLGDKTDYDLVLTANANDRHGLKGTLKKGIWTENTDALLIETDKTLYRTGEALTAYVASTLPDGAVVVDLVRDSTVIRSGRVQLHNGRASVNFPYDHDFKDRLTIAVYPDFANSGSLAAMRTVLYPPDADLEINTRTSKSTYKPGEEVQVSFKVEASGGRSEESALGVVLFDKAVADRARTDREYGSQSLNLNESLQHFLGLDQQLAGVSLRDLQRLDRSKKISAELDLLAEILLSGSSAYFPTFYGSERYDTDPPQVFGDLIRERLSPIKKALENRYLRTGEYPKNDEALRTQLFQSEIGFNTLLDPWGTKYRTTFSVDKQFDVLTLVSAGADKRFDNDDDFSAERFAWAYFRPMGETIDRAVRRHHERTGSFIRDLATLRKELSLEGLALDQMLDRWGQPYHFSFEIDRSNYLILVKSLGPDRESSKTSQFPREDFVIWTSKIDYFAGHRARIEACLSEKPGVSGSPNNDEEFREVLRNSGISFESLRDPWNRPYYTTFHSHSFKTDVRIENRANFGETPTPKLTPITRTVTLITLNSLGPDGKLRSADDFGLATLSTPVDEYSSGDFRSQTLVTGVVSRGKGEISGVVTDTAGAIITGATITAKQSPGSSQIYTSSSSADDGKFILAHLLPGLYEVRVAARGFMETVFTNVLVRAFNATPLDVVLRPGAITQVVEVSAGPSVLQTMSSYSIAGRARNYGVVDLVTRAGGSLPRLTPRLREYFPETLVWQPSIETDTQGRAELNFKLADNITTWKLAVIGSTEDGRIGVVEKEIEAFQPFFVEHDPPRILTEGDEISLPVIVRNYLDRAQQVDLEMKPENWFSLIGPARKHSRVGPGDAAREIFDFQVLTPTKESKQRVTAIGSEGQDAIEKPITVHPDGEEVTAVVGDIVGSSKALEFNVPENVISNSARAELRIYPNLLSHVIESVEAIMARPYGCGEQTISSTYPSLMLLRYYKQRDETFPLRARAQRYLEDGYGRLLSYRHSTGGFSYWGHGDADLALTGYALRFLSDARQLIAMDEGLIDQARDWLLKLQQADGSWANPLGRVSDEQHSRALLTAYLVSVLALTDPKRDKEASETKISQPKASPLDLALKNGLDYLSRRLESFNDPYLLASYALAAIEVRDKVRGAEAIKKLLSLSRTEQGNTYWSPYTNTPFYGWGLAGTVETTGLVVQALSKFCDLNPSDCQLEGTRSSAFTQSQSSENLNLDSNLIFRALLFLHKQKDRYGVWFSSQATINVLSAMVGLLTSVSESVGDSRTSSRTEIFFNGRYGKAVEIPTSRFTTPIITDISSFLKTGKNTVEIRRATGSPYASVQVVSRYYIPWYEDDRIAGISNGLRLLVKFDKTEAKINEKITCQVEVGRTIPEGHGMLLAEIGLPPGAEVDRASLETAIKSPTRAIDRYEILPDRVILYLWLPPSGTKFDFQFHLRFGIKAKTAASLIYDYYNPEARAVVAPVAFTVR